MKKLVYLFLLATQIFWAQSGFEKGNELYRKEKYEDAVTEYESILKTKKQSAELYFNLGNAYYKLNKVAPAVYNFEKALLLSPNDADIQNNLKFAHKMMIDEVKEMPKLGFRKSIQDFTSTFDYNAWAWISVGMAFLFLLFFCGYYFSGVAIYKRIFFIGMFIIALLLVLSILSAVFEKRRDQMERPAIVFAGIASVKSEPKESSADAFTLHEGTKVYVLEVLDNWKRVQLQDGSDGWIEAKDIKELK
ncbi:MAG TPA: tetratricopeptide repeat protein [Flavobacterium sp.]|nr:tetratricopeptide repeat protein [Flavobacterium sp.]